MALSLSACAPGEAPAGDDAGGGQPDGGGAADASTAGGDAGGGELAKFSFFVTSLEMMRELSKSQDGFGGDLRFGEATGLAGADKICRTIAERSLPGASRKTWRAFLSASTGGANGGPVHAIERIGGGPWYDRLGRLRPAQPARRAARQRPGAEPGAGSPARAAAGGGAMSEGAGARAAPRTSWSWPSARAAARPPRSGGKRR